MEKRQSNPIFYQPTVYVPADINDGPAANIGNAMAVDLLGTPDGPGELWVKRADGTSFRIGSPAGTGSAIVLVQIGTFVGTQLGDGAIVVNSPGNIPSDFVAIGGAYRHNVTPVINSAPGSYDITFLDQYGDIHFGCSCKDLADTAEPFNKAGGLNHAGPAPAGGQLYDMAYGQTGVPGTVLNAPWSVIGAMGTPSGSADLNMTFYLVGYRPSSLVILPLV